MTSLEKKYKSLLSKNEADSYLAYVSKSGVNAEGGRQRALEKATSKRALLDTDYGSLAMTLDEMGLNGSGYEDYIASKRSDGYTAEAERAEEKKLIDDYINRSGYAEYLSDYEALQEKMSNEMIKSIGSGDNLSIEDAYLEALNAGISKNLAYATAKAGVEKAKETIAVKAIKYAKTHHMSAKEAEKYALGLGLDAETARIVYDAISTIEGKVKLSYSKMSASEYYDYVRSQSKE